MTEQEIDARFGAMRPRLFGALLDALAVTLAKLPTVRPERLPRLADFGRLLAAADAAGVTEGALDAFLAQQGRIAGDVLDADPFASAVVELVRNRGVWEGTASELLADLLQGSDRLPYGWPKRNGVSGRLKRLTPALAVQGIEVHCDREPNRERRRLIRLTLRKDPESIVHNVQTVQTQAPQGQFADAVDNADDVSQALSNGAAPTAETAGGGELWI